MIAYHFTGRSTDESALKELVFHLIELCFNISLKVIIVTSDMGSANRAVWRLLNFSNHRHSETVCSVPHPHLDGRQLYFMADPAHVLKNIRAQPASFRDLYFRRRDSERAQPPRRDRGHPPC